MARVVLFHSAYGLRPAVRDAAERLRRAGHQVRIPDLYGGNTASGIDAALALRDAIGRDELLRRARAAVAGAPAGTVLAGFSLGASLALRLAAADARFGRLLLMHGVTDAPASLPAPWSVQVHVADDDPWAPREELAAWRRALERMGARVELHRYAAGHLFTDAGLPDFDARAAEALWRRAERFLGDARDAPVYAPRRRPRGMWE